MAFSSAWLLRRSSVARSTLVNSIVFYVLVMMASMFAGAVFYFLQPTPVGLAEALGLNMVVMSVGVIAVLHFWATSEDDNSEKLETESPDEAGLQRAILISRAYVIYFLVMMASMTAVGFVYILDTAMTGLDEGLVLGNAIMVPGIIAILWYASKHPGETKKESAVLKNRSASLERWVLVFLVLLNEFFMGWTFLLATGNALMIGNSFVTIFTAVSNVLGSDWFLFTLAFEILFSIYMLRNFFSKEFVRISCLQAFTLIFVPTVFNDHLWATICILSDLAILGGLVAFSYRHLYDKELENQIFRKYLWMLLVLDGLIVTGSLIWIVSGNYLVLFVGIVGETVLYFNAILERIITQRNRYLVSFPTELDS